ncbi:Reverse transcriptase domain [Cinara cedri]|uniref:Reverse transcriptase domain n=1 Tax=Cinara cedri TaxID=506608 RepID=A0A5E4M2S7_9HEMI|nr:Reverse transcriptase domain [Cinara cedri]
MNYQQYSYHTQSHHHLYNLKWSQSLLSPLPMALPAKPASPAEIRGIIKKLANRKSPGHDLITNKRLSVITNENKNLPNFQFGFRANHSTTHQLHRIDTISTALETKKYCTGVFLDVAKAFDTDWHEGLLFKLKTLFSAPYYLFLKSYLDNHTFKVCHNLQHSKQFPIAARVPQGSDIAPFLYIIFTSDLPTSEKITIGTCDTAFYLQLLIISLQAFN